MLRLTVIAASLAALPAVPVAAGNYGASGTGSFSQPMNYRPNAGAGIVRAPGYSEDATVSWVVPQNFVLYSDGGRSRLLEAARETPPPYTSVVSQE